MTIHHSDPWLTIHGGDCRDVLATLPDASVHMVCTSPPYWGLRDYGTASWDGGDPACDHRIPATGSTQNKGNNNREGKPFADRCGKCGAVRVDRQLGLEATPEEYVANMVAVFREVRRVLRDDGTLWLNLGDSYASGTLGRNDDETMPRPKGGHRVGTSSPGRQGTRKLPESLKPKDLVGIPWRVAFALQADGWYLRSDIIWAKPNPMPESVTDRPTKSHEMVFLLSKSPRYFYDAAAVREPHTSHPERIGKEATPRGTYLSDGRALGRQQQSERMPEGGRNRRTVWTVATQPYPGAHFAVMPEALVEPCVLAGTSERGVCPECGAPWERVVEREVVAVSKSPRSTGNRDRNDAESQRVQRATQTTGWRATCNHDAEPVGAVVLDPFGGSGTVARVANRLSRRAILIDLNPDYLAQQLERNRDMPLGLTA